MDRTTLRRATSRLLLGIDARFVSLEGTQLVVLQDISATGARIEIERSPSSRGFLQWMGLEVFCEIQWRRGKECGLEFDRPISKECLFATRQAAPALISSKMNSQTQHAREFVAGL